MKRLCAETGCSKIIESPARKCAGHLAARKKTAERGYGKQWQRYASRKKAEHIERRGQVCPGWGVPAHQSDDLTVDHDVGVLCRSCNSRKAAVSDRGSHRPSGGARTVPRG